MRQRNRCFVWPAYAITAINSGETTIQEMHDNLTIPRRYTFERNTTNTVLEQVEIERITTQRRQPNDHTT